MSWEISKAFEFDYGHRVWTQQLQKDFSIDTSCACKHYHGHRGKIIVYLESEELNRQGMITDFKHLNWFKKWIDEVLDHKFIMDRNDPVYPYEMFFFQGFDENELLLSYPEGYYIINPKAYESLDLGLKEKYEGMVFVDFVPTSENLSKWVFGIVSDKMKQLGITVSKIEFYETPKSKSSFLRD